MFHLSLKWFLSSEFDINLMVFPLWNYQSIYLWLFFLYSTIKFKPQEDFPTGGIYHSGGDWVYFPTGTWGIPKKVSAGQYLSIMAIKPILNLHFVSCQSFCLVKLYQISSTSSFPTRFQACYYFHDKYSYELHF